MNIVLLSRYFPPEIGTAANLFYELARQLVSLGNRVTVVTGFPWYNLEEIPAKYRGRLFMRESLDGVEVVRVSFPLIGPKKVKLALGHLTAPVSALLAGLMVKNPDIVYVYSPPLFMGISAWLLRLFKRVPFVFGVQDLHPQCYIDQGVLKNKLSIAALRSIERFCYKKAAAITVHSAGNREYIKNRGIDESKIRVLHNWVDTDDLKPLPRINEFSKQHDLNNKFVVGYAGTLGMSQGLLSVIEAARLLKDRKDIEFFIVGDGIEKKNMIEKAREYGLDNIRFLPMQSKAVYPLVVASCDVGLVTLNKKVKTPVVPSKILSMMAAERPVLASMPLEGDAPKLINESECGLCIEAEEPALLAEKLRALADNRDKCLKMARSGRDYVVENFSLKKVAMDILNIFTDIIKDSGRK
ncbi:MAG: glycosyltransferase family 4 protein [Candidatus Margulisiibacteriota bacterium]